MVSSLDPLLPFLPVFQRSFLANIQVGICTLHNARKGIKSILPFKRLLLTRINSCPSLYHKLCVYSATVYCCLCFAQPNNCFICTRILDISSHLILEPHQKIYCYLNIGKIYILQRYLHTFQLLSYN